VFVKQPLDFENPKYPNSVYKLSKALYRLKQVPRAWYARLKSFLLLLEHDISFLVALLTLLCHVFRQ
jgi:hypothetical protein